MYSSVFSKAFSLFLCKGAIPSVVLSKKIAFSFSLSLSCRTFASMKIGNVEFGPYPVFLAPMEDVTDIGFRLLCKRFGAAMVYSEFVAADALVRMVNRSLEKLAVCDDERPVAIQIYGKEPGPVADAARIVVERARPDVLDLNFGCPVKRVAGKGAGAGMLQNIPKMLEITRAVVDAVDIPVTVKTRLGWDESSKVIVDLAESLQDYGRTRAQMYTGEADWTLIGEVKNNPRMTIPIIGNGDITSPERARECFDRYGVDAVMVGRATFGHPWIFKEIMDVLNSESVSVAHEAVKSGYPVMSADWKIDVLKEQVLTSVRRIDEYRGILHSRRHLAASPVFKGIPNFRETRIAMLRAETVDELFAILERAREAVRQVTD